MRRQHTIENKEPRPAELTREEVVAHLGAQSRPQSIREIAHGMDLKHRGRRYLPRIIQQLKRAGEIEEIHGGRYRLAGSKAIDRGRALSRGEAREVAPARKPRSERRSRGRGSGKPQRARDPNLDLRAAWWRIAMAMGSWCRTSPFPGVDGDLFIGHDNLGDAMHGDRVLARIVRRRPDGRAEGRIVQIVERQHPTIVGLFRYGPHGNVRAALRQPHSSRNRDSAGRRTHARFARKTSRGFGRPNRRRAAACGSRNSTAPW